jgi:hypothetical protein
MAKYNSSRATIGDRTRTHGMSRTREYEAWCTAKKRCYNPNCEKYPRYGGRGITMCKRWLHPFESFLSDMGMCPKGYSIDRSDNDGNYTPSNCTWATLHTQTRNRRANVWLEANGKRQVMTDWVRELGIDVRWLKRRLAVGKTLQEIINEQF